MTFIRRHLKLLSIGAACAAAGAGASAIATAGAAGTSTTTSTSAAHSAAGRAARRAILRRAVQGDVVVASKNGFATVSLNRGFVQSVSGRQLTIREGTKKATYKTVTLTIPADATVRDNGKPASLSQLTTGQRVGVVNGPNRTWVTARNAA